MGRGANGGGGPGALVPDRGFPVLPGWMFNLALFVHGAEAISRPIASPVQNLRPACDTCEP